MGSLKQSWNGFVTRRRDRARSVTKRIVSSTQDEEVTLDADVVVESESQDDQQLVDTHQLPIAEFSLRFWLTGAVVVVLLYFMRETFSLLTLILAAYIISVAIEGPIRFFRRLGMGRGWGIFLCYFGLALLIVAIMMVIPFVIIQLGELTSLIISLFQQTQTTITELGWSGFVESRQFLPGAVKDVLMKTFESETLVAGVQQQLDTIIGTWQTWVSNLTAFAWKVTSGFAQTMWQSSLVIVLSIFFSIEKDDVMNVLVKGLSRDATHQHHVKERMIMMYRKLQLWLKGQLFLMLYIMILVYIGFWILEIFGISVEKKELLALMAGVTELVPYLGPLLGAIPALLVASLSHGVWGFLGVGIIFAIAQWTENNVVVPVVMNKVLGVSALLIFICMLLGGWIFGFVGILLSVPFAVIISVLGDKEFGKEGR